MTRLTLASLMAASSFLRSLSTSDKAEICCSLCDDILKASSSLSSAAMESLEWRECAGDLVESAPSADSGERVAPGNSDGCWVVCGPKRPEMAKGAGERF